MNKKGFAATGILYTILVLFILLFSGMLTMLYSRNNILIQIQNQVKGNIYKDVTLNIKGTEYTKSISSEVDFDISGIDISDVTNIACNNGAEVIVEGNHVIISKVLGGTICKMNTSLATTASELDSTKNYILMLNDETLTTNVNFLEGTNVQFYLNSRQLNLNGKYFRTYGNLVVNGDSNSKIISTGQVVNNSGTGVVTINGGYYERNAGTGTAIYNEGIGTIIINKGTFMNSSTGSCVQNRLKTSLEKGNVIINNGYFESYGTTLSNFYGDFSIFGGIFISHDSMVLSNNLDVNIDSTNSFIYMSSLASAWKPVIKNVSTGTINIKGTAANECTNDSTQTTSGLCVYAEGDKNYESSTSNVAITNQSDGTINIDGGTFYGGRVSIYNYSTGTINIKNGFINSGWNSITNVGVGIIDLCNANINAYNRDFWNDSTGIINYSTNVTFTNGTNNPNMGGVIENIVSNYVGTCSQ